MTIDANGKKMPYQWCCVKMAISPRPFYGEAPDMVGKCNDCHNQLVKDEWTEAQEAAKLKAQEAERAVEASPMFQMLCEAEAKAAAEVTKTRLFIETRPDASPDLLARLDRIEERLGKVIDMNTATELDQNLKRSQGLCPYNDDAVAIIKFPEPAEEPKKEPEPEPPKPLTKDEFLQPLIPNPGNAKWGLDVLFSRTEKLIIFRGRCDCGRLFEERVDRVAAIAVPYSLKRRMKALENRQCTCGAVFTKY